MHRFTTRGLIAATAITAMTIAGTLMLLSGLGFDDWIGLDETRMFRVGLASWLIAATSFLATRTGVTARVIEASRQAGYDAGYADGNRPAFPVVVKLRSSSAASLSVAGPTQQLTEQRNLGEPSKRIG